MPSPNVGACHHLPYLGWGGGSLLAADCGSSIAFSGRDQYFTLTSSERAERAFCKICRSRLRDWPELDGKHIVPAGPFSKGQDFNLDHQIFVNEKSNYFGFANMKYDVNGEEVCAQAQTDQP